MGSLIIAAVIAAVALLALVIVTGLYLKRTTTYKAIISGDRKSSKTAFTNRAFKASSMSIQMTPRKSNGVELNGSELNRNSEINRNNSAADRNGGHELNHNGD